MIKEMLNNLTIKEIKKYNKFIIYSLVLFLVMAIIRYLLGFKTLMFFDSSFILLSLILVVYVGIKESKIGFKVLFYFSFYFYAFSFIFPAFEYLGELKTLIASITYIIPFILVWILTLINNKKIKKGDYSNE